MYNRYEQELNKLKSIGNYRFLRDTCLQGKNISFENSDCINFSSNDYLGILSKMQLNQEFFNNSTSTNMLFNGGSGSSRLLAGNSSSYATLENFLAKIYQREACLVFNSGYHANIGILPALSTKHDLIVADKLVHASIIDGLKLCDAKVVRFKHNDLAQVDELLAKSRNAFAA